jgi:hypothetical protein
MKPEDLKKLLKMVDSGKEVYSNVRIFVVKENHFYYSLKAGKMWRVLKSGKMWRVKRTVKLQ